MSDSSTITTNLTTLAVESQADAQAPLASAPVVPAVASESQIAPSDQSANAPGEPPAAPGEAAEEPQEEEEEAAPVEEPYEYGQCTITISIQLLPDDGDPRGRPVIIGVRNHQDAPIVQLVRGEDIAPAPWVLSNMLSQLASEMPARKLARDEREAKRKKEEAERESTRAKEEEERKAKLAARQAKATKKAGKAAPAAAAPSSVVAVMPQPKPQPEAPEAQPKPAPEPKEPAPQQISLF